MKRTLLVTNDFPPRKGGIQTYLEGFIRLLDPQSLVVYTSEAADGSHTEYDAAQPWRTYRYGGTLLLPLPQVKREMQEIIREEKIEVVWFGAAAPLGILAEAAREAGAQHIIATTHGHEIGWSMIPGARRVLKKIFTDADTVTYLTKATLKRLSPFIPSTTNLVRMPGGINPEIFAFSSQWRTQLRERYGIGKEDPVIVCISRLVERKGQDLLLSIWPELAEKFPRAHLVIVGTGPYERDLLSRAHKLDAVEPHAGQRLHFTGEVPYEELAAHYSLGDIFAMPCRTRGGGLDIEGLGLVYLEAYAAGLPVVAGNSGGAPEAVIDGETGFVVNGRNPQALLTALSTLLENPERARAMGQRGKEWLEREWRWEHLLQAIAPILDF